MLKELEILKYVKMEKEQSKTIITSLSLHEQLSVVKQFKLLKAIAVEKWVT